MNFAEFKQQINASLFFVSVPEDWNEEINVIYTIYKTRFKTKYMITREQSDKLFEKITCNENREMTKERFFQAIKELEAINELHDWEMFKVFAKLHPVEAYDSRPDDFCKFMRGEGYNLSNEQIKKLVDSSR